MAVVGQDVGGAKCPDVIEISEVGVHIFGFGDIGYCVLHRVARQQDALLFHPDHCCIITMNVELKKLQIECTQFEIHRFGKSLCGHNQRIDSGKAVVGSIFNC